jgi:hypothetical protein
MNRRKTLVAASILVAAAATLLTTAAASASPRHAAASYPRTLAGARTYLASLGIDARTVVIQRGAQNYAGPNCPGRGWTCTTSKRVLQLGKDKNDVDCTGTGSVMGDTQTCTVIQGMPGQTTGRNNARCVERSQSPAAVQVCSIEQNGAQNTALVIQEDVVGGNNDDEDDNAHASPGESPTQTADQTTEVTQTTGAGGTNSVSTSQRVLQNVHGGTDQSQNAHQELTINQNAPGAGSNTSTIEQDQRQNAYKGVTQSQNTSFSGTATPCPAATLYGVGNNPNQCAFVHQGTDAGTNVNSANQTLHEKERSQAATDQLQGSFAGGVKLQADLDAGTGTSTNTVHQDKNQDAKGPAGVTQHQFDPMGCCGFSAQGNDQSTESLDQSSTQQASGGTAAVQQLEVFGFVHTPTGGTCSITQHASDNADSSTQSASSADCTAGVGFFTDCTSGEIPEVELLVPTPAQETTPACTSAPFFGGGD